MKTYSVTSLGYDCPPEFNTLEDARKHLADLVADSMAEAKRRGHKPSKHKLAADCYRVTLGTDKDSTIYDHFSILTH